MKPENLSRRQFLGQAAVVAGTAVLASTASGQQVAGTAPSTAPDATARRTASDQVELGKTGLKVSRLGLGLEPNNGQEQAAMGQEGFNNFIKHAFDQGITMFDTAQNYRTYGMLGAAIKDLPRDKIFIQSKIEQPANILSKIDDHRKALNIDYVDSMLVHIQTRKNWTDTWKQAMDDYSAAQDKKWIKIRGVSCHSLPALRSGVDSDWTQVHLVRVNPQGLVIDGEGESGSSRGAGDIQPVIAELKRMKEKQRAVIAMKVFGNGQLRREEDREKSLHFAMSLPEIDSVIIGFGGIEQFDAGIKLMNKVLAAA